MIPRLVSSIGPIVLVLGAAACSTDATAVDGPIELRVGGGFTGTGDGQPSLHIELDGAATREHADGSEDHATLSRATIVDLRTKITNAQFDALEHAYISVADDFTELVSVTLDGSTYTVEAGRMSTLPPKLGAVIDTLVEIREGPIWH
jgi:hypothetical protein